MKKIILEDVFSKKKKKAFSVFLVIKITVVLSEHDC